MLKVTRRTREVDIILNQQTAEDIARWVMRWPRDHARTGHGGWD